MSAKKKPSLPTVGRQSPTVRSINTIRRDKDLQARGFNQDTADSYASAMSEGGKFPPVLVYYDGTDHWLVDGFHRLAAYIKNKTEQVECVIVSGTKDEARWAAISANREHDFVGLRRTNADKVHAVEMALGHPAAANMSNRDIAKHVGVSPGLVDSIKNKLSSKADDNAVKKADDKTEETADPGTLHATQLQSVPSSELQQDPKPKQELEQITDSATAAPLNSDRWKCETKDCKQTWPQSVDECGECLAKRPSEVETAQNDTSELLSPADKQQVREQTTPLNAFKATGREVIRELFYGAWKGLANSDGFVEIVHDLAREVVDKDEETKGAA